MKLCFLSKLFKAKRANSLIVNNWLHEYIKISAERNLKPKTIETKTYLLKVIQQNIGEKWVNQNLHRPK